MDLNAHVDRRVFLKTAAMSTAMVVAGAPAIGIAADRRLRKGEGSIGTPPVEELMREHGLLRRIFLIYEETIRQIQAKKEINPAPLNESAGIVQKLIHDYHERMEEEYLFPPLMNARHDVDTVYVLIAQHREGRKLTEAILKMSTPPAFKDRALLAGISSSLAQFIHMYRPHAAREDTAIIPHSKKVLSPKEYSTLAKSLAQKKKELMGRETLDRIVGRVERIEKELGIYELTTYNPKEVAISVTPP